MDEINYNEVFGISETAQEAQPVEVPQAAESEPVQAESAPEETGTQAESAPSEQAGAKKPQTAQENAHFAAARRKAKWDAELERAKQAAQDEAYAKAFEGKIDPYTKKPIRSKADYDAYKAAFDKDAKEASLKKLGVSSEQFDAMISEHPTVKQAQQVIENARTADEAARRAKAQAQIDAELLQIQKLNPDIHTLEDIVDMPTGEKFVEYIKKGNSLEDAYYLANRTDIANKTAAAASQAARNSIQSKEHLQRAGIGSTANMTEAVPQPVMDMYRQLNPKATDAEITAHYNKNLKRG